MKEQWRKEMQQKLAGYRQPAPDVSWSEVEKAITKSEKYAPKIPSVWRRVTAAAMIIFACGGGFIVYHRHTNMPHKSTTAFVNRQQTVSTVISTAVPATHIFASSTGSTEAVASTRHAVTVNSTTMPTIKTAATTITHQANNTTKDADATSQGSASGAPVSAISSPHKQKKEEREQQRGQIQQQRRVGNTTIIPVEASRKTGGNRLVAGAFISNVAMTQSQSSNNVPMLAAADPIGMYSKEMEGRGSYAVMNRESDMHTEVHHRQPVRFGLSLRYHINDRWSLESGVSYTYLTSDITRRADTYSHETRQRLSYIGIPVNANYRLWHNRRFNIYASGGGTIEKMVKGKATTKDIVDGKVSTTNTESVSISQPQFSVTGAIGAEFKADKRFSLYAEPGLSYYFDNKSNVTTIYQDKPLNFNLNIGIRINIQ